VMTQLESHRLSMLQIFSQAASAEMPDTNGANGPSDHGRIQEPSDSNLGNCAKIFLKTQP
jgi:hypothetical protein